MNIIIDIETGISKDAELFMPTFEANKTLKDKEKIADDLTKKMIEWESKCALSPLTGEVLAVGQYKTFSIIDSQKEDISEEDLLNLFWNDYGKYLKLGHTLIGHNLKGFDLPFLYRRSLKYGIKPLWNPQTDRYNKQIVDTMELWSCGLYPKEYISLDNLAKFLGVGEKSGSGKDFAKLFKNPGTRQDALDYLKNDLEITYRIAEKLL